MSNGSRDRPHRHRPGLGARRRVHREELAAERTGDPLLVVEQDVQREVDAGRRGDRPDRVVDGVALDDAPGRPRVADPPGIVEGEDRVEPGQPRRDHLGPAAEPGEEVRLHEPGRDPDIGLHPLAVEQDRHVADASQVHEARSDLAHRD